MSRMTACREANTKRNKSYTITRHFVLRSRTTRLKIPSSANSWVRQPRGTVVEGGGGGGKGGWEGEELRVFSLIVTNGQVRMRSNC